MVERARVEAGDRGDALAGDSDHEQAGRVKRVLEETGIAVRAVELGDVWRGSLSCAPRDLTTQVLYRSELGRRLLSTD